MTKAKYQLGDRVITAEFGAVPFVITMGEYTQEHGWLYSAGSRPWYREEQLSFFLTDDEKGLTKESEALLYNAEKALRDLREFANKDGLKLPEGASRFFYAEYGRLMGFGMDLT